MMFMKPVDIDSISPERRRIAKIFKAHIDKAVDELGSGYSVKLRGKFDATPISIEIEIVARKGDIP